MGGLSSLSHLAATVVGHIAFLLAEVGILELASLIVRGDETILASFGIDLVGVHGGELLGGSNVVHLFEVTLRKDEIDLFQSTSLRLN